MVLASMRAVALIVVAIAPCAAGLAARAREDQGINVCYFTNWARYRGGLINTGDDVFEMGLDAGLCTHFMYGFATVTADLDLESNDPNADHPTGHAAQDALCPEACNDPAFKADWSDPAGERCDWPCSPTRKMRGYEGATVGMRRKNPDVKVLISVGGWNFNDCAASAEATVGQGTATCELFSRIASSDASIRAFARNVIAFCRRWGFDGFDLDWEYPVVAGHNSNAKVGGKFVDQTRDYENYITMLRVMKEEFAAEAGAKERLLLTAAVGVGLHTAETAYDSVGAPKQVQQSDGGLAQRVAGAYRRWISRMPNRDRGPHGRAKPADLYRRIYHRRLVGEMLPDSQPPARVDPASAPSAHPGHEPAPGPHQPDDVRPPRRLGGAHRLQREPVGHRGGRRAGRRRGRRPGG